jgi:hypothetical protein
METLSVHDWDEHQTYRKDRGQPPWIKVHRHIMRNLKWLSLDDAERGQLVAMWLLAADHDGVIPASPHLIQKLCFMSDAPNLRKFIDLGFLEGGWRHTDAALTPPRRQHDAPKAEAETEKRRKPSCAKTNGEYTAAFEEAWAKYPRRPNNNKQQAFRAWKAQLNKGVTEAEMIAGVERYARHIRSAGKEGSEYVKLAATFFGPNDHFRLAWESARPVVAATNIFAGVL